MLHVEEHLQLSHERGRRLRRQAEAQRLARQAHGLRRRRRRRVLGATLELVRGRRQADQGTYA